MATSAATAHTALLEKVEESKESLTAENAFHVLKKTAQRADATLSEMPTKTALLYGVCIVAAIKFPLIRKSISTIIYPEQIFKSINKIPNTLKTLYTQRARDAKLVHLLKENQKLKQYQPPTLLAQTKEYFVGKPAEELLPASVDFDGLEHEAVKSKAVPSLFSKLKLT
jgi:surfactin synthase thioesterase subunit